MKKILLSLMLLGAFTLVKAQVVVLNEIYGNPGSGNSEFIELYNSGSTGELDCYTILTYWEDGVNKGWYVLQMPTTSSIGASPGFFVLVPSDLFSVQGTTGATANLNWNDATFRSGFTGGYLEQFQWNGSGYTDLNLPAGTQVTNLLDGTLNGSQFYITLLYKNGILINGFIGGGADGDMAALLGDLGSLTLPLSAPCGGTDGNSFSFTANFNAIHNLEFWNPAGGNDNGYARDADGKCGSWIKTSSQNNHTPGLTNGSASGDLGAMEVAHVINCSPVPRTITADVTAISGLVTIADDFPIIAFLYLDVNADGELNDGVPHFDTLMFANVTDPARTSDPIPDNNGEYIVAYRTQRGCFDLVLPLASTCATLPVNLKLFTAARSNANVGLVWETATEENNKGFYIQRKIGAGAWVTIGFVPSQAFSGNSFSTLRYEYTDNNPTKGITQYRLRQIDIDNKSAISTIRAVRGMAQRSNVIIYPNPSNDGKVNVVFEDVNVVRNVSLMDMSGRMLKQWRNVSNNNIQIDNLTPGFYSVRIENTETGELVVEKIVVNKR